MIRGIGRSGFLNNRVMAALARVPRRHRRPHPVDDSEVAQLPGAAAGDRDRALHPPDARIILLDEPLAAMGAREVR